MNLENERVLSIALRGNGSIKDSLDLSQGTLITLRMLKSLLKLRSMIDRVKETDPIVTFARIPTKTSLVMKATLMIKRTTTTLDHLRTDKAHLVLINVNRKSISKTFYLEDSTGPKAVATRTMAAPTTAIHTSSIARSHLTSLDLLFYRTKTIRLTCLPMTFPSVAHQLSDLSSGNPSKFLALNLSQLPRSHSTPNLTETRRL